VPRYLRYHIFHPELREIEYPIESRVINRTIVLISRRRVVISATRQLRKLRESIRCARAPPSTRLAIALVQIPVCALQVRELSPAEAAKEDGNAAFKRGDLPAALAAYTLALEKDPALTVAANNRAMVNLRMQRFGDAESDCNLVRTRVHAHAAHCKARA